MKYELNDAIPILKQLLQDNKLNIFVGSGISIKSGIPTWDDFIVKFLEMASDINFYNKKDAKDIKKIIEDANERLINVDKSFNAIEVATVLKNRLKKCVELRINSSPAFRTYNSWITLMFNNKKANENHKNIVSTDYPFVLTTNYDCLLQDAAYYLKYIEFSSNMLTYEDQIKILEAINQNISSMIHIHGVYSSLKIDKLIFTKEDYNKIILKKYEGFSFALRMLFSRYSTLFVGYGASDPHLEEVLEELAEYFPVNDNSFALPESFLVTLRDKADTILEEYKERVGTNLIIIDNFDQYDELLFELQKSKPRIR